MFTLDKVEKVYSGRTGCMCGCQGKYSYATGAAHEDWQGTVNDRSVKIMFNKIMRDPARIVAENFVYVNANGRTKVVYFK